MSNFEIPEIRSLLDKKHNVGELKNCCQDLGIDYEKFPSTPKDEMIRGMIEYCKRNNSLDNLVNYLEQKYREEAHSLRKFPKNTEQLFVLEELEDYYKLKNKSSQDYLKRLQNSLEKQEWKKADEQTFKFMLFLAGQEIGGILKEEGCKKLFDKSQQEVLLIDKLWMNYSNEKFGFSVQKSRFQHVARDFNRFCINVGWRTLPGRFDGLFSWKTYDELNFDTDAEWGHLPFLVYKDVNASKIGSRLGALSDSLLIHCIEKIDFSGKQ